MKISFIEKIFKIVSFIWQFPQLVFYFIMKKIFNIVYTYKKKFRFKFTDSLGKWKTYVDFHCYTTKHDKDLSKGITLTSYRCIVLTNELLYNNDELNISLVRHEFGHSVQSAILGWFYIPIIILPTFIRSVILYYEFKKKKIDKNKYEYEIKNFYAEKWADWIADRKTIFETLID